MLLNNVENFAERFRREAHFKIQLVQELKLNDLLQRRIFRDWTLGKLAEDPLLCEKIVFSDEAHFWLNEYVNKQNC